MTVFHLRMARAAVESAGLQFWPLDRVDDEDISRTRTGGLGAPAFSGSFRTVDVIKRRALMVLREGPDAIQKAGVQALIADQMDLAVGTVAEHLGLPFVNVSCGPPLYLEATAPAPYFGWPHASGRVAQSRNRFGNMLLTWAARPVLRVLNEQRRLWGLKELKQLNDAFSRRAIITQLPQVLEFRRPNPPGVVFYTGPFHDGYSRKRVDFPWDQLNGKPLVYASMGTIRNDLPWVFRMIAEACGSFPLQLVMSLGAGGIRPRDLGTLPGSPIVVDYAPQLDLIRRSRFVINCAGLNTVLDCVSSGVPIVALPVAEDQPGVAARVARANIGIVLPLKKLTLRALMLSIDTILHDSTYTLSARHLQSELAGIQGLDTAADLVEERLANHDSTRTLTMKAT